jgi:ABC-2 type transport system permease protein
MLVRLVIRQHRLPLLLLVVLAGLATAAASPSYGTTYSTAAARIAAAAAARANAASTLLYGVLPEPGRTGQIAVWELGSLTCLVVAIVGSLLAVRLSRGAEDSGLVELVRSCGIGPARPEAAALVVLVGTAAALGLATSAGLLRLSGITSADAASYGASVAVTFLLSATATMAVGQLVTTARQAQLAGGLLVAGAFLARGAADTRGWTWLGDLSALSVMQRVAPATDNNTSPLLIALCVSLLLAALTFVAARRRDLGAGLLPSRAPARHPLHVRSAFGLDGVLTRRGTVIWAITCAAVTAVLAAMGVGTVQTARESGIQGGFLGSQLSGGDPALDFLRYVGTIAALLASACAIILVARYQKDERGGLLEVVRSTGIVASRPLASLVVHAAVAGALVLGAAAACCAWVFGSSLGVDPFDAVRVVLGQWPAVMALAGIGALAAGTSPQLASLSWVVAGFGALVAFLGKLLDLPNWILDSGLYAQAAEWSSVWLVATGLITAVAGCTIAARRDLRR